MPFGKSKTHVMLLSSFIFELNFSSISFEFFSGSACVVVLVIISSARIILAIWVFNISKGKTKIPWQFTAFVKQ